MGARGSTSDETQQEDSRGLAERAGVLRRYEPTIELFLRELLAQTKRKDIQADDTLDAAAAFITAEALTGEIPRMIPVPPVPPVGR